MINTVDLTMLELITIDVNRSFYHGQPILARIHL